MKKIALSPETKGAALSLGDWEEIAVERSLGTGQPARIGTLWGDPSRILDDNGWISPKRPYSVRGEARRGLPPSASIPLQSRRLPIKGPCRFLRAWPP